MRLHYDFSKPATAFYFRSGAPLLRKYDCFSGLQELDKVLIWKFVVSEDDLQQPPVERFGRCAEMGEAAGLPAAAA